MIQTRSFFYFLSRIIVFTALIRIVLAYSLNLGNDEVYYFTYAVQPDWNHFDHPPLIGLFIRLTTLNLGWISELSMRLPAIAGAAINTWLIARSAQLIKGDRAGLFAAVLYNASLYTSIISGVFILPDSVQLVFWMAALYTMLQILNAPLDTNKNKRILYLGLWIGLTMMCKIHGIFLWFGFFGYILFHQRDILKNPYLYLSIALTAGIISPILFWNINNNFITWRFHSERVTVEQGINFKSFLVTTIGQILYANPVQFIIYFLCLKALFKGKQIISKPFVGLLLWCSLPIIFATTVVSLFRNTLPHWSGPGFLGMIILSAAFLDSGISPVANKTYHNLLKGAVSLILFVCIAGLPLIYFFPGTLSNKAIPETGSNDFTLDLYGWNELLPAFQKIRQDDILHGTMSANDPIVAHKWFPGAHLYYYVAYPLRMRFVGIGNLNDLHKFKWLNSRYGPVTPASDAYYISPSNSFTDPKEIYAGLFGKIEKAATITQKRNGKIARYWYVYRLRNAR